MTDQITREEREQWRAHAESLLSRVAFKSGTKALLAQRIVRFADALDEADRRLERHAKSAASLIVDKQIALDDCEEGKP